MKELFKPIPSTPDYEAGEFGTIRSKGVEYVNAGGWATRRKSKVIKPHFNKKTGYYSLAVRINKKQITKSVHRLIAEAWHPNPYGLPEVNHKDGNKSNNTKDNLEWITRSGNHLHRFRELGHKATVHKTQSHWKAVVQLKPDGEFVSEYRSLGAAAKATRIDRSSISSAISGKYRFAGGYKWVLKENYNGYNQEF